MSEKIYAISINKPNKSFRIHLMDCRTRILHENRAENQTHIENITFDSALALFETSIYEDKNFCKNCLKKYELDKNIDIQKLNNKNDLLANLLTLQSVAIASKKEDELIVDIKELIKKYIMNK